MRNSLHHSRFGLSRLFASTLTAFSLSFASVSIHADEFTNFMGIKLVDIPAGNFQMGSCKITKEMKKINRKRAFLGLPLLSPDCETQDQIVNDNETPQHKVDIQAFRLAATPVTLGQYKKYLAAIGARDATSGWNLINEEFKRLNNFGDNAPVVQVSWNEAREFIEWLNENKPLTDRHFYRFASEAEWEYACRAGSKQAYCGSDSLDAVGWVDLNKNSSQQEVATKTPNAWGIYDMTGNIWEWVGDVYHENYNGAPTDGSAWTAHTEASAQAHSAKLLMQNITSSNTASPARAVRVSNTKFTDEQRQYDKANTGAEWQRDTGTSRVLRGGSWRFSTKMAGATYRLSGEPGNWYYGNGFRIAATLP